MTHSAVKNVFLYGFLLAAQVAVPAGFAEVHAKSSYLGAAIAGRLPKRRNDPGELKNESWRFAVGLDNDVVNPSAPTTINFTRSAGAGNVGFLRSQVRVEHYCHPCEDVQLTTQFALSDPVVTSFRRIEFAEGLVEDNGWPNVEGRLAIGLGSPEIRDRVAQRPFEAGVSGLVGQLRAVELTSNVVADVWMVGGDIFVPITSWCGNRRPRGPELVASSDPAERSALRQHPLGRQGLAGCRFRSQLSRDRLRRPAGNAYLRKTSTTLAHDAKRRRQNERQLLAAVLAVRPFNTLSADLAPRIAQMLRFRDGHNGRRGRFGLPAGTSADGDLARISTGLGRRRDAHDDRSRHDPRCGGARHTEFCRVEHLGRFLGRRTVQDVRVNA